VETVGVYTRNVQPTILDIYVFPQQAMGDTDTDDILHVFLGARHLQLLAKETSQLKLW